MALNELQRKLLPMLAWFHEYCKQKGLRYYLIGGTALGAARHQGFIPWDDDIDVGMPREDYERLQALCAKEQGGQYRFEFPGKDKTFVYTYGKLYDTQTTLIENSRYKTKRGIFLDVFPLDGVGDAKEEGIARFREIDRKVNLLSTKTCAWRKGRKLYKNLATIFMRYMPFSAKKLRRGIEELSKERKFDDCKYVANYVGNWHEKEISERAWFGIPVEVDFDGVKAFAPENVDAYLTGVYGDWRTPPPPEKQITHHDYISLDLRKSYLE